MSEGPSGRTAHVVSPCLERDERTGRAIRHDGAAMTLRPLPLLVVGALVRRCGWTAVVVDENHQAVPEELPDLALISAWTATAPSAYRLADWYRERGVPVVLGGVHPSMLPTEALRHADSVVAGEAESVLHEVLADVESGTLRPLYHGAWADMANVPGIGEYERDYVGGPWRRLPVHSIQTSRGCRFNCSFCSVIRINGRGMRHMEPDRVAEEIDRLRRLPPRLPGGTPIYLLDDDLMSDREYSLEMFDALARARIRSPLILQVSSAFGHDEEMMAAASRAGCVSAFIGFESLSRASLLEANKKNRPHLYAEIVDRVHRHGIGVSAGIIFGFDDDHSDVFDRTVDLLEDMHADSVRFTSLTPMPGTETFARYYEDGRIRDFDWSRYDGMTTVIEPLHMTPEQLQDGLVHAYRRWYGRKARVRRFAHQSRHVSLRVAGAFAFSGRRFASSLDDVIWRPSSGFQPEADDLVRLAETSRAPASEAITHALAAASTPLAIAPEVRIRRSAPRPGEPHRG